MGQGNDSKAPFASADDAFRLYNADANYAGPDEGQHYYDFRYADAAFFVMDTRRYRSDINEEDPLARTMLGDKQLSALYDWLGRVRNLSRYSLKAQQAHVHQSGQHNRNIQVHRLIRAVHLSLAARRADRFLGCILVREDRPSSSTPLCAQRHRYFRRSP